jgi:DNA polymerase I-like protein with 3'-5' exonuclease and polymerase domains
MEKYAPADSDATLRLHTKFKPVIDKHFTKPYETIMKEGTKFLIDMEEIGVPFSRDKLNTANLIMMDRIHELKEKFWRYPETKKVEEQLEVVFNPNSTVHLRKLFFDILGLKPIKKTPKGEYSTDKDVLAELTKQHEIPKLVSELRGLIKQKSTYIDKVLLGLDKDQRLRTGFHLHTVTSGRLSSSGKLNMQQLPRDDKTVKSCIVPILNGKETDDWVIFSQDLKTAEMYYAAALSGDRALGKVFQEGGDFHSSIAKAVFKLNCSTEELTTMYPQLRQAAKAISFGILYGAGPFKVAETANISIQEAQEAISDYFGTFPQLRKWISKNTDEISRDGATYSHFGRKRRVPNVFSASEDEMGHAIRSAFNFKVQSVASDVNLLGAIDNHKWIKENKFPAEIFGLVHDSILGMVKKDAVEEYKIRLQYDIQMDRGCSILGSPIGVDFGTGGSYAKAS